MEYAQLRLHVSVSQLLLRIPAARIPTTAIVQPHLWAASSDFIAHRGQAALGASSISAGFSMYYSDTIELWVMPKITVAFIKTSLVIIFVKTSWSSFLLMSTCRNVIVAVNAAANFHAAQSHRQQCDNGQFRFSLMMLIEGYCPHTGPGVKSPAIL